MYFIITAVAAAISTILWYRGLPEDVHRLGLLCLIYWGATLMWAVDHIIAFIQEGGPMFDMSAGAAVLGLISVAAGAGIWLAVKQIKRKNARI